MQRHKSLAAASRIFSLRSPWTIFWAALIIRLIYISFLKEGYYFSDFRSYEQAALSLLSGDGFGAEYDRPPLYPIFLAGNYLLFGAHFFPVRVVQAILAALGSCLIYRISSCTLNERAGRIAGWVSVFYPYYIFISGLLYPTLLSAFLHICVIYLVLLSVQKKSVWATVGAGVCLGFATLGTPVSLAFLPLLILWYLLTSNIFRQRRIVQASISLVVVILCLLPWTYYNYERTGRLVLLDARAGEHLPYFTAEDTSAAARKAAYQSRMQTILAHPGKFLSRTAEEFLHFWSFVPDRVVTKSLDYRQRVHQEDERLVVQHPFTASWLDYVSILTYGPVFFLALAGMALCVSQWRILSLIFLLLMSQALGYSLFFTQVRYRLPVEFCLMIFAAAGLDALLRKYREKPITA